MSRFAPNCKWCGDRPGGCLYCIDDLAENDEEKLLAIQQAINRGEIHVMAVRTTQEVLLRPANGVAHALKQSKGGSATGNQGPKSEPPVCTHHLWAHDTDNFNRRHCTRPGCLARQRFEWLPDDPNSNGRWVDVSVAVPLQPVKKAKRKTKINRG